MERDPNISKLIRESGLTQAPVGFSERVMGRIGLEPQKGSFKPLIGRRGRFLILLFIIGIAGFSLWSAVREGALTENAGWLSNLGLEIPQIAISFDFLEEVNLSTWLVSTIVALFLLVLSDAGLHWRRLI